MLTGLAEGDVVWTNYRHQNGSQWIRVVVLSAVHPRALEERVVVRPLFEGDVPAKVFSVRREDIQVEEPTFDQLDSTYEGDGEFEFA